MTAREQGMKRFFLISFLFLIAGLLLNSFTVFDLSYAAEQGTHSSASHTDPFSFILLELGLILAFAIIGRWLAKKTNQPAVLGELLIGVIIGNIGYWFGLPLFTLVMHMQDAGSIITSAWQNGISVPQAAHEILSTNAFNTDELGAKLLSILTGPDAPRVILMTIAIWMFSNLGVILLLFMVGLESKVSEMASVGSNALMVAVIGVVAPLSLGYLVGLWLLPDADGTVHLFLGATLCATSVGITARVFKDLKMLNIPEAKVILGAAVIDDVLSLIVLAVVVGIISSGQVEISEVSRIVFLSALFLGVVIFFGEKIVHWSIKKIQKIEQEKIRLLFPLCLLCFMSFLANQIELASIIGAFAAGLILSDEYFSDEAGKKTTIEEAFSPLESIFAPVFFILMGMQVNLASFTQPGTLSLAIALTVWLYIVAYRLIPLVFIFQDFNDFNLPGYNV